MTKTCRHCGARPTAGQAPRRIEPARPPAGARLLDYFGPGTELAVLPGGFLVAMQADHTAEMVRLEELRRAA